MSQRGIRLEDLSRSASGLLELARVLARLKSTPRTGWLDRGVPPALVESVADHSHAVALLAWVCAVQRRADGADLDPVRVLKLALLHDLAEAETGDAPPYDPASIPSEHDPDARRAFLERRHVRAAKRDVDKRIRENAAMQALLRALPRETQSELGEVWADLRDGTSAEARFTKQVDRLETFLQSRQYRRADPSTPVSSFQQEVMETVDDPLLAAIRDAVLADESRDTCSDS